VTPFFVLEFYLLLDAVYLQFVFTGVSFSLTDVVLRLRMQTSYVFVRINGNYVTIVGLTKDERCLIHYLRVKKH